MFFYDEINRLCKIRCTTIDAVMKKIGKTSAVYFGWRARDMFPRSDDLYNICKVLEVPMEHFFEDDSETFVISKKIKPLVDKLEKLAPDDFQIITELSEAQLKNMITLYKSIKN